jgi:hypothetical protein
MSAPLSLAGKVGLAVKLAAQTPNLSLFVELGQSGERFVQSFPVRVDSGQMHRLREKVLVHLDVDSHPHPPQTVIWPSAYTNRQKSVYKNGTRTQFRGGWCNFMAKRLNTEDKYTNREDGGVFLEAIQFSGQENYTVWRRKGVEAIFSY